MKRAFVFITGEGDGADGKLNAVLRYGDSSMLLYGVNTLEQGLAVCEKLSRQEDCSLIELCGGFAEDGARKVAAVFKRDTKTAYTVYMPRAQERLSILDGAKNVVSTYIFQMEKDAGQDEIVRVDFPHGNELLIVYGVHSEEQAIQVARKVVDESCILIEVCCGLGSHCAEAIMESLAEPIPVGHVVPLA